MTRNIKEIVNHDEVARSSEAQFGADHVMVLLAHYNGARHLGAQLDSIAGQTHKNWSVVISDDGSDQEWLPIVADFAERQARGRTWITSGPCKGIGTELPVTRSQSGADGAPMSPSPIRTDVWLPEKLAKAVARLRSVRTGAARNLLRKNVYLWRRPCTAPGIAAF